MLEIDLFAQFSGTGAIFLAAFVYARQSRKQYEAEKEVAWRSKGQIGVISSQPSAELSR
jgi:hypothetical protein